MLYLVFSIVIVLGFTLLLLNIINLIKVLIKKLDSYQSQLTSVARSIVDLQSQLDDSNIESKKELNKVIDKFNKRLDKTTQESLTRDNLTLSHLNKTIRQLNNGFHPEELESPK